MVTRLDMDVRQWPARLDNAEFCHPEPSFGEGPLGIFPTEMRF